MIILPRADLPPVMVRPLHHNAAELALYADLTASMGDLAFAASPDWFAPNEPAAPYPYPFDVGTGNITLRDQLPYYPANAATEYGPQEPLLFSSDKLHPLLRLA